MAMNVSCLVSIGHSRAVKPCDSRIIVGRTGISTPALTAATCVMNCFDKTNSGWTFDMILSSIL